MENNLRKLINNEYDYLRGNINRICVTDNLEELEKMRCFAISRIDKLYLLNKVRIEKKGIKD